MIPKLTIAIPTHQRPAPLTKTVAALLPQLTPEVELLILDNHSPTPAKDVIGELLTRIPTTSWRIVRHATNVGGNQNILRCFEHAHGVWVWTLGDDDDPAPDAVAKIMASIAAHPDADHFNFCSSIHPRRTPFRATTLDAFLDKCDSLSNGLFISANVYRRDRFIRYLPVAANHLGTNMAQLVLLFAALQENRISISSDLFLIGWEVATESQRWPHYFFFQFLNLVEVLPDCAHQRKLLRLLDFAEKESPSWPLLRWSILSQFTQPTHPSALLFLARGAHLRAILYSRIQDRMRWRLIAYIAGVIHRHQSLIMRLWRGWHRLRHKKDFQLIPLQHAFLGHHSHINTPDISSSAFDEKQ
jgi:glycosyltransferase involved in cell wall biosynthesis